MEKPMPSVDNNTGLIRDGVHIVIPDIVTRPVVQYIIRDMLLADARFREEIAALKPVNPLEDVVDKAVIENNNWTMYGSKKPAQEPYLVTRSFVFHAPTSTLTEAPVLPIERHHEYVERLSIRNKYDESPLRGDTRASVDALQAHIDDKQKKRVAIQKVLSVEPNDRNNTVDCLETVKKIVAVLDPARNDSYHDWVRLGWCLRNIDHRLLDAWTEFSRGSPKYMEGECAKLWRTMRRGGLGMGPLYMWAKRDNPAAYRDIIRNDLFDLIHRSISGTHHDVARVVHHMYRYDYACASIRHGTWYEFRDHKWVPCDSVHTMRKRISLEMFREYIGVCAFHNQAVMREDTDESEQAMHAEKSAKLNRLAMKLKDRPFKENVVKECCELFYHERFEEMLDSNPALLGFNNGVYDLDDMEFREGRPDDYISFSTKIDYVPYDKSHECVKDIETFFRQVHPNPNIRRYVITLISSFLSGNTHEERFHIWTGTGSNGKSKVIDLLELALGEYCCKLPVTLLTGKRAASNAASSEVARAKGKRFACLQEPSEDEKLNVGLMKELSGGDTIVTRALFKDPIQFKPMFKMLLLCNHLPNVPSDDGGTWRRIRVVEFGSKFVQNPTKENEFPVDIQIGNKFKHWAPHFMAMLLETYRQTRNSSISEPEEVLAFTRDYQKNNDYYADFVDTCIERINDTSVVVTLNDIFQEFKDWVHSDNIPVKVPKKKEVHNYMVKNNMGKASGPSANPFWKGFRFRDRYALTAEDEEGAAAAGQKDM
jgi:P4 family phage/plasmid primase-like protien